MFIARDEDGELNLFNVSFSDIIKITKTKTGNGYYVGKLGKVWNIDKTLFPFLKWEDEPIEVELKIREK